MNIHLIDGTYELFRNHFGAPPKKALDGREVGATLGLLRSLYMLVTSPGVTHVGVAFDHVIESFRNELYPGYKTSAGVDPNLLAQFPLAEEAVSALGVVVWPMVEFEADDALGTAARRFKKNKSVEQILICSPDKDLAQLVEGQRIVCWDRKRDIIIDEAGVVEKFGVSPQSMPDWLALVGDNADGYPGLPGWGPRSAATVLQRHRRSHDHRLPASHCPAFISQAYSPVKHPRAPGRPSPGDGLRVSGAREVVPPRTHKTIDKPWPVLRIVSPAVASGWSTVGNYY